MKKTMTISLALVTMIMLMGCTSNQEVEELKRQNALLQQQANQLQTDRQSFENDLKCQERGDVLKKQYNNIFSVYYNELAATCYVKYYDSNQMLAEGPIEDFGQELTISTSQLQQSVPELHGGVTYQEIVNVINGIQQPGLKSLIVKLLLAGDVKSMQIIIGMKEGSGIPIESRADGYFGQYTLSRLKDASTWLPTH